ncbi:response regulator transcription factor [Microvirga aerilata]|jgi:two-component system, NarL family, nitrate/nitrite response regulator NarL|uniref:Response regulator transcription factor n=1 Tax=Microvirga aerilata TaxID=670292 RepID=A0A936ZJ51_9HYPH|nr:response regulator transcription factor [Microvirga aerilata]MBL0408147.1 response regulator transcription factor [Microvirga aerilata]
MNHDVVYNEQILPIAQSASSYVTTVLVCQNTLIRSGISHMLSGTQFFISEESPELTSELPTLYLIHTDQVADGLTETIERLKAQWPSARVVLLTERIERTAMVQAFQAGLDGLCSTTMDREPLIKALELVMLGETFISQALTSSLLSDAAHHQAAISNGVGIFMPTNDPSAAATANRLSPREAQILRHLTQGASNKLIARELGLAEATIKVHLKAILRKAKVANRTQAAMWAQQHLNLAANDVTIVAAE